MATLEKIRSKSVFLIVVIGVALLAFIVGDAITNSRNLFGSGSTVGKIGSAKVDISEYQERVNMLQQAYPDADAQLISQEALDQLLNEKLLDEAVDKLGIKAGSDQLRFYIVENPLEPAQRFMQAYFPNSQMTPTQAYEVIFNPEKNGMTADQVAGMKEAWLAMEKETQKAIARYNYERLLFATIQPNELDKKALFAEASESYNVNLAKKPYGVIDEKKYKVSDADLKAEWEKNKELYAVLEPTKSIGLITMAVMPSDADIKNAQALMTDAYKAMKAGNPIDKKLTKEGVRYDRLKSAASNVNNPQISSFLKMAATDTVALFDRGGSFDIVKVQGHTFANDSVEISFVQVLKDAVAGVRNDLSAGMSVDSLNAKYTDKATASPMQWIQIQSDGVKSQLPASLMAQLDSVRPGQVLTVQEAEEGSVLAYVNGVKAPVPVYDYELVSYELYPSAATLDAAREKLENYGAKNNTPEKFKANADKSGGQYMALQVNTSTPALSNGYGYMPRSRQVVKWAMADAEKGDVSDVMDNDDNQHPILYLAIVADEYDDYVPYTDANLKEMLTQKVRASKAGDDMLKQYSGKGSLAATAKAMGVEVENVPQLRYGVSQQVSDPVVSGRITGTAPGKKFAVVKGVDGIYAYEVVGKNKDDLQYFENQVEMGYATKFNPLVNQMMMSQGRNSEALYNPLFRSMLRGKKKITNNLYKFESGK